MTNENNLSPLFKEFWPSNWNKKSDRAKIDSCQKLENYLAAEGEREPYKVKNYDRATQFFQGRADLCWLGRTNPLEKTIEVNVKGSTSSFDVLMSLVKESAHADQHELIETMKRSNTNPEFKAKYNQALKRYELSDTDVIVMKWEHKHPYQGDYYEQQYTELDARQRCLKFLTQHYTCMGAEEDIYKYPQTNDNAKTNFKDYLDVKGNNELRLGKELVNDRLEQELWLELKKIGGMFTHYNNLYWTEQEKVRNIFLNDHCSMSDFKILNKVKNWETEKSAYLEEAEKMNEAKASKVTLEELEGKQLKKRIKSTHETTPEAPKKTRNCLIL